MVGAEADWKRQNQHDLVKTMDRDDEELQDLDQSGSMRALKNDGHRVWSTMTGWGWQDILMIALADILGDLLCLGSMLIDIFRVEKTFHHEGKVG